MTTQSTAAEARVGPPYIVVVDGTEVTVDGPTVTAQAIMDASGVTPEEGLIELLADGTQRAVDPDETFDLQPGKSFIRAPKFKRG